VKIIVYEHVCGGGYAGQPISADVLAEGFAMLRSVVADFKAAGRDIVVLLDARIAKFNPPLDADCTVPVFDSQQTTRFLTDTAKTSDAIYIIAPETDGTLQSLVALGEQTGKLSFNAESSAIRRTSDKGAVYKVLRKLGAAPKGIEFSLKDDAPKVKKAVKAEFGFPSVFKPVDGVSCEGLSLVEEENQISKAIAKIKSQSRSTRFIAQEFVEGEAASVSVLCTGKKALAVSLNKQHIRMGTPDVGSGYLGGAVPFNHPRVREACILAERVVEAFAGLRGYVGIDMVLAKEKPLVVDVNPRLTTSYVGLSKVANFNVAEAILNASLNGKLPKDISTNGFACFQKIQTPKPNLTEYKKILLLKQAVTPPFPLKGKEQATAFVVGHGKTLENAESELKKAKERLCAIVGGGRVV
jgi:predicted ATP-grasp superfamily ATP-dependent carboligase